MNEIDSFFDYLKNERRFSVHTLKAYRKDLDQFSAFLASLETDFFNIDDKVARGWLVYLLEEGVGERSVNRKLSAIKSFYRFLIKQGAIDCSPLQSVKVLKTPKRTPSFVRKSEMDLLLLENVFEDNYEGLRDKLIIHLLYFTGMRLSELINLKESDVGEDVLKVLGKRSKERYIPLTKSLTGLIKKYKKAKETSGFYKENDFFLLLTDKGDKLYEKFVFRKVKYYLGLITTQKDKSPHVLRHTFATQMLNAGADLNAIKEILGHADLSATQVYTHNSIEKLKGIYKQAHPRSGD